MSQIGNARRRPLAACIGSVFALASPALSLAATTWNVTSCADSGAGTLRDLVGAGTTLSGDTVDLSFCAGSTISLTTAEIFVNQASLAIQAPTDNPVTIDGSGLPSGALGLSNSRLFTHTGVGANATLSFFGVRLTGGHVYHVSQQYPSLGGCVYSKANVVIFSSTVSGCYADQGGGYYAAGGGIYAKGNLTLKYSTIDNNFVSGNGGGARVLGNLVSKYSTTSNNDAANYGGGFNASGNVTLTRSTVSGNTAKSYAGVDAFNFAPAGLTFRMNNSTISGNVATVENGGLYVNSATAKFYGSTIAFNEASSDPGVVLSTSSGAMAVTVQSTLMANNAVGLSDNDLAKIGVGALTFNGGDTATPANNLIRATIVTGLPNDTKIGCPLLGPLRNNGGLTQTHALLSTSPAIDSGNVVGGATLDQRGDQSVNGEQDYVRASGPVGDPDPPVADIGAYEVQQDDVIFNTGHEGCHLLF